MLPKWRVLLCGCCWLALSGHVRGDFVRGDTDLSGTVDVADVVGFLQGLFAGAEIPCGDAADSNDDGELTLVDALSTLGFVFRDGAIPNPGPLEAGPDPTCDALRCESSPDPTPAVLLSEIHYNPIFSNSLEFVELFNRTPGDLDISGYRFTDGIAFTVPDDTVIPAGGFVLVVRDSSLRIWRRNAAPAVGPYQGTLADGGERLRLVDGDGCLVESVRYDDRAPWPAGSDGYGPSLERIDYLSPAADPHSWRASVASSQMTPGIVNSTLGTPTHPFAAVVPHDPLGPTSSDAVEVRVAFDVPRSRIARATVRWQGYHEQVTELETADMAPVREHPEYVVFAATLPPQPSQSLVRYNVALELDDGRQLVLPHEAEPNPFFSYFVYDFEIESRLPVLWLFWNKPTDLLERVRFSGVVIHEVGASAALVFDGAQVRASGNGLKVRFLRGEEYRDDRTLNVIPEPGRGSTGRRAPHMEHLGFQVYRDLGGLAPRVDWFRVIDFATTAAPHTQRLVIQQVNERFLAMNGLDDSGDLYKLDKGQFSKKTNIETGMESLNELRRAILGGPPEARRAGILERFDLESVRMYSVIGVLIENWDGFHNNLYAYNDLSPGGRWKVIPWDLDQVFEPCCPDFPITFPLDGVYPGDGRTRSSDSRFFAEPYHSQPDLDALYREAMKALIQPGAGFSTETLLPQIDAIEALLLEDLALEEAYLGAPREERRAQITDAYNAIRQYVRARIPYLLSVLE